MFPLIQCQTAVGHLPLILMAVMVYAHQSAREGYDLSMWHVARREARNAVRSARYSAFRRPISCWPRGSAPSPALLKEPAALTLSSKLDK